jgi:hypothetical protein
MLAIVETKKCNQVILIVFLNVMITLVSDPFLGPIKILR